MRAKLISYSKPALNDSDSNEMGVNELIAYCARVSNPSNQMNHETSDRLIAYLIKHKHWSPLEMASACVEVNTTRDIARQMLRHRSFSFQEFSQRYADPTQSMTFEFREARLQDVKNRQNSIDLAAHQIGLNLEWKEHQQNVLDASLEAYKWAIANGIAKEQARAVLPEGMTQSRLYMSGTLRSFVHYIEVRTAPSTQKEHREVATAIAMEIAKIFPLISEFVVL